MLPDDDVVDAATFYRGGDSTPPPRGAAWQPPGLGLAAPARADFVPSGVPRLDDDITLVCELLPEQEFLVRAERTQLSRAVSAGHGAAATSRSPPYLPPHIWHAINGIQGRRRGLDSRSFIFPFRSYEAIAAGLEKLGNVERIPAWVLQAMGKEASNHAGVADLAHEGIMSRLFQYQRDGVRFGLLRRGRCLIGDEMGLGKTVQALALVAQYATEWPVLVVCPSMLRWVWKDQIEEWISDLAASDEVQVIKKGSDSLRSGAKFWIISYDLFSRDAKGKRQFQQRPNGEAHEIVIADESHNIKEWKAERTKATVPLLRNARRAILLSGTPTRNQPDELHPQLCGLLPNNSIKFKDFQSRYCIQEERMLFGGRLVSHVVGARNASELNHLLTSTVMVRRLKKDVLAELPPKRRQKVPLEVSDSKQMRDIQKRMTDLSDLLEVGGSGEAVQTLFLQTAMAKLPAVKEYLLEVLDRGDEKAIVFAHHKVVMDEISELLKKRLAKDGLTHIRIDGQTPGQKREALVREFQTDPSCRIALLSITACSEGITLTAAGLVIFAELYWVPGVVEQAEARAHRIGTNHNKVVVEFLVVPNSPDVRIYNSLERKKKDTSNVLDGAEESLGAFERLQRARKRPASPNLDSHFGPADKKPSACEAEVVTGAPLGASSSPEKEAPRPRADALETPPPVSRAKIEYLLRGARG